MTPPEITQNESGPRIRHAKVDSICIYEVTENELDTLENGSPASLALNFSVFLLSIGISFLITLLTTQISSIKIFNCFVIVACVGMILGTILFFYWLISYLKSTPIISKIKNRLDPEPSKITGDENSVDIKKE